MNPEVKEMWVSALDSGEYEQGKGQLRTIDNKFCCLGVLCDLAVKHGVDVSVESDGQYYYYGDCSGMPPESVYQWAGLTEHGIIGGEPLQFMNDAGDTSFHDIALHIKEYA